MKIIKEGKVKSPKEIIYTGSCKSCACEVECDETEVRRKEETSGPMEYKVTRTIVICPTKGCASDIYVIPKMSSY